MGPLFRMACLVFLMLSAAVPGSAGASDATGMDTLSIRTADDSVRIYSKVEPWPGDFVRASRSNGTVEFIPAHRIRRIHSPSLDLTDRVLVEGLRVPFTERRSRAASSQLEKSESCDPESVVVPENYRPPALRGRPLAWQAGFPLLQGGILACVKDHNAYGGDEGVAITDVGYMRNIAPRSAIGGTISLVGNGDYLRIGVKPRVRHWMSRTTSVDFALGGFYCVDDTTGDIDHSGVGVVGEASVNFGDFVSITNLIEISNVDERVNWGPYLDPHYSSGTELMVYFGVKAGGEPGIPAAILTGLSAVVLPDMAKD